MRRGAGLSVMVDETLRPGRTCPLSYHYGAAALNRKPDFSASTLYIAGGLYGNPFALRALLQLQKQEPAAQLVFNGDFNWFNKDDETFEAVNREVLRHRAIRGNVETELLSEDAAAGCGCGYPDYVSDADVARSNAMMGELSTTAKRHLDLTKQVAALPMTLVAEVAGLRVGIVHGDADSLAGWSFGEEAIEHARLAAMFEAARVRVFASSHTCLPVGETIETANGDCALFNNGAAGMPNFAGTGYGLVTRLSAVPAPSGIGALYGTVIGGVHVDCLPLVFDQTKWLAHFDSVWPKGSPAELSYRRRIVAGPGYQLGQAIRGKVHPATRQNLMIQAKAA